MKETFGFTDYTLAHAFYGNSTVQANFTINKLPTPANLNFTSLTSTFKNTLTEKDILNNVTGDKKGYTLKNISNLNPNTIAEFTGTPKLSLHLKKAGSFTATLVLEHPTLKDATINHAGFEITKLPAKNLTFNKLTTAYKKILSKTAILAGVQGEKTGYTLKSISNLNPNTIAELTSTPKLSLHLKKIGSFTATLVLEHPTLKDATINHAQFEIIKGVAKKLTFEKLIIPYKNTISKATILKQVKDIKEGYKLKAISGISAKDVAEFTGSPQATLQIKKAGSFTAILTLEHPLYLDTEITGAEFEITKLPAKKLTFKRLTISSKTLLREKDLLARIPEVDKNGYTLKSITSIQVLTGSAKLVEITGSPVPSIKINEISGIFTVDITLKHPLYLDVTLTGATFEKKEQIFIFDENTKTITGVTTYGKTYFATATEVTFPDQINGVDVEEIKGSTSLSVFGNNNSSPNRTIKTIHLPKNLKTIGNSAFYNCYGLITITLSNSVTTIGEWAFYNCVALTSINIPKSVTTIGQHAFKSCNNVVITIKQTDPSKIISVHAEAFDNGVLKIKVPSANLSAYKTADIWKKWKNKMDAIPDKKLAFKKLTTYKAVIPQEDMIAQVTELSGVALEFSGIYYTIKSISNIKASSGTVEALTGDSGFSIKIKEQTARFTADLVLQHPLYLDMTITGASFEKEKAFVFDAAIKTITGVTAKYKTYFATDAVKTGVTFPGQIDGVDVEKIKGANDGGGNKKNIFGSTTSNPNKFIQIVYLPKNLKTIGINAFSSCEKLLFMEIPDSVITIGNFAFNYCGKLTSIKMGNSVKTIGQYAFHGCTNLIAITIPKSVTSIGSSAFSSCSKLLVTIKQTNPILITVAADTFNDVKKIKVPTGYLKTYKTASNNWSNWASKM